jgi:hypothetical protein
MSPNIIETSKTKKVEINENEITVKNFESTNSFLESPSIKFCFMVLLLYSLDIIETMTMARNSLKKAVIKVLKCHI